LQILHVAERIRVDTSAGCPAWGRPVYQGLGVVGGNRAASCRGAGRWPNEPLRCGRDCRPRLATDGGPSSTFRDRRSQATVLRKLGAERF